MARAGCGVFHQICPNTLEESGKAQYLRFFITDGGLDAGPWFRALLPLFLEWAGESLADPAARMLVHCQAGVSRSVSLAMAWLMW